MLIYIYVDDLREPGKEILEKGYPMTICRTAAMALTHLAIANDQHNEIILDLDHDLGKGMSGYDICKYVVAHHIPLKGFKIHSMNPVGAFNMRQLLTHYGYQEI